MLALNIAQSVWGKSIRLGPFIYTYAYLFIVSELQPHQSAD